MKDLYLQLGLDPSASAEDIEAALKANPELGEAAAILLNEPRRAAYNRTVSTVRSIGMLRHRLGLDRESTWFVETCPDFAPGLHIRKYVPPAKSSAETAATAEPSLTATHKSKPWLKLILFIIAAAVLLALLRVFL